MQNERPESKQQEEQDKSWYVLYHLSPSFAEVMLRKDCNGEFATEEEPALPPYRYYLPFKYLPTNHQAALQDEKEKKEEDPFADHPYDPYHDANALRQDMRAFVFIQAPLERIMAIVRARWNRDSRLHLFLYRDTDGSLVRLPNAEVQMFIRTLEERHLHFFFDQPLKDFTVGDKVIIQREPWQGRVAEIKKVRVHKNGILLTVSMNILGRIKSITFTNVTVGDVRFVNEEQGRFLSGNPVDNYEQEILDLLNHRFIQKASEELQRKDQLRLKRLAAFSHIYAEEPIDEVRLRVLQLLCAYLRSDTKKVETDVPLLLGELASHMPAVKSDTKKRSSKFIPDNLADVYRMIALFIITRNPLYRDAVKGYRKQYPDIPVTIRRFISILKVVKAKNPDKCQE